ncbi:Nn.00g071440.m01.CDS01 [Neocucurbitaria sp. VM-36]
MSFQSAMEEFHKAYEAEIGQELDFIHDFHEGLSLLRTCRQIYHKAVGILYGENTFVFSRVPGRHDLDPREMHADTDYYHPAYAAFWLWGIGTQIRFLRNASVDVDALCPPTCGERMDSFDVLPLMRLFWLYPDKAHAITFTHTGRQLDMHLREYNYDLDNEMEVSGIDIAEFFNKVLRGLTIEDALNLLRYEYSSRLVDRVELSFPDMGGRVYFKGLEHDHPFQTDFRIKEEGNTIEVLSQTRTFSLNALPWTVRQRILKHAIQSPKEVVIDLDFRRVHGLNMEVFQLDHSMRRCGNLARVFSLVNRLTIELTSTTVVTSFDSFSVLRELIQQEDPPFDYNIFRAILFQRDFSSKALTLLLKFQVPFPTTLSSIRIDMKEFMCAICKLGPQSNTTIRIALMCSNGNTAWTEDVEVPFDKFQRELFLLLSDILAELSSAAKSPSSLAFEDPDLPEIWVTGRGVLINANYETTSKFSGFTTKNRHSQLSMEKVRQRGYHMSTKFAPLQEEYMNKGRLQARYRKERCSLLTTWNRLRWFHWEDWESHMPPPDIGYM